MLYTNPFDQRKSEQLESAAQFHKLFGCQMVEVLQPKKDFLWEKLQIIRSAPGGGKTSLMRLFTAESLDLIYKNKRVPEYDQLFKMVSALEAIDKNGPCILGVRLPCSTSFVQIEDAAINDNQRDILFFTLMNARALMAILEAVCILQEVNFPEHLTDIEIVPPIDAQSGFTNLFGTGNGKALYEAASRIELEICRVVDSISGISTYNQPSANGLVVWQALKSGFIKYKGVPINQKALIMLDDIQDLSERQRKILLQQLLLPYPTARWVAERYQALDNNEVLQLGSNEGREYVIHRLEEWAYQPATKKKYQKGLTIIADKRVQSSNIIDVSTFESLLDLPESDGESYLEKCQKALEESMERVMSLDGLEKRFLSWIRAVERKDGTALEKAIRWRTLEILIARKRKRDATLFPDDELPPEEMDKMNSSSVQGAARLFISKEYGIPYYYGMDTMKLLSSGNVDQFLQIAGAEFSELIASATLRKVKTPRISAIRQQNIIQSVAKNRIEQIPMRIPNGTKIKNLVYQVAYFAQIRTYEQSASYAPGITGIGISLGDQEKLSNEEFIKQNSKYSALVDVIKDAIAFNIFEVRPHQHCKGQEWLVLYLNRLFCSHFWLPIEYGGWKEQKLDTLVQWISEPPDKKISQKGLFDGV